MNNEYYLYFWAFFFNFFGYIYAFLPVLSGSAMYLIGFHPFVVAYVLRPERMVFAQDHSHAQQHDGHAQHDYCQHYCHLFANTIARILLQNRLQRYNNFCIYANISDKF